MIVRADRRRSRIATGIAVYRCNGIERHRNEEFDRLLADAANRADLEAGVMSLVAELSAIAGTVSQDVILRWMAQERAHSIHVAETRIAGTLVLAHTVLPDSARDVEVVVSLHHARSHSRDLTYRAIGALASLSPRERQVALLLADGCSNRTTAERLGVSEHTARRHTERVLRQLGLTSRQQVAPLLLKQA